MVETYIDNFLVNNEELLIQIGQLSSEGGDLDSLRRAITEQLKLGERIKEYISWLEANVASEEAFEKVSELDLD